MAYQLSPGVNVSEIDLSTIVPAVGTTTGAFVGNFNWGPVDYIMGISDENGLVNTFGKPDANTYESFFTAANFLAYGNNLKVVRTIGPAAFNATGNVYSTITANGYSTNASFTTAGVSIKNRDAYESNNLYSMVSVSANGSLVGSQAVFAAKYPGALGNSLKVAVYAATGANGSNWYSNNYSYASLYNSIPNTSTYSAGVGGAYDEMHITVVDDEGLITGVSGTVLEKFGYVSKASDAKNSDGSSNYYVNVLNDQSKYVYAVNHLANTWGSIASNTSFTSNPGANTFYISLSNGADSQNDTGTFATSSWDKFKNSDETDVSLLITGSANTTVTKYVVDNIAEVRKDCVVFISPKKTDVLNQVGYEVSNITTTRNTYNASSYAFMDSGWKYQFDKYNNVYRWVPLNGDIAGLCARTDQQRDPWFSPAGYNRGQIKNVVKLAWNPTKANRDDLYKIGVNSVVSFPGDGTILYGDKTMQTRPSAFDRINVRRLFIVLEKAIARAAKYSLFEFNDEFTRAQFKSLVEPYLRDIQGRRGIFDFRVVCDGSNNTPEVIDRNEFVGDIYIKPARSINFIQLNFVAVRTGVSFETIVGRF